MLDLAPELDFCLGMYVGPGCEDDRDQEDVESQAAHEGEAA